MPDFFISFSGHINHCAQIRGLPVPFIAPTLRGRLGRGALGFKGNERVVAMGSSLRLSAMVLALVIGAAASAGAQEVIPAGSDQESTAVRLNNSGIEALHGVKELKGADLATIGVDISPTRGFAIMRDAPTGPGISASPDKGFEIGGKTIQSMIGLGDPAAAGNVRPMGIPGASSVPGAGSVPLMGLPVISGIVNSH